MQEFTPNRYEADPERGPNQLTPDEEMADGKLDTPEIPDPGHEGDEWVQTGKSPEEEKTE